jgi:phenylpropionate dioxygenase-like ring-hydroxylating dioxygenase large terminal subunit
MLRNFWYLVCPTKELKQSIKTITILGENIVFFRNQNGTIIALEDRCCHRNVKLSLGFLEGENIVCGYHGWRYNNEGKCVQIPSQTKLSKIPQTAEIKSYPVREFNRWIWIFIGDEQKAGTVNPVDIPEMAQWDFTYKTHFLKADLESAAESLIDPYHIAFVHRNSIRSFMGQIEDFPASFNLKVVEDGIEGVYNRANKGNFFEKMYFGHDPNIKTIYRFYYPSISRLQLEFKQRTLLILENIYKVDENHIAMMQITLWQNIFSKFPPFARYFMSKKSEKIVSEDIILLQSQVEILNNFKGKRHEVSVKGDEISLAFRKYWRKKVQEQS